MKTIRTKEFIFINIYLLLPGMVEYHCVFVFFSFFPKLLLDRFSSQCYTETCCSKCTGNLPGLKLDGSTSFLFFLNRQQHSTVERFLICCALFPPSLQLITLHTPASLLSLLFRLLFSSQSSKT